jgi:hypothetical protein
MRGNPVWLLAHSGHSGLWKCCQYAADDLRGAARGIAFCGAIAFMPPQLVDRLRCA